MKKISLLIALFLMMQICHGITAAIAQENEENLRIKNVIEAYLNAFYNRDINSAMQLISVNYYAEKGSEVIDYAKFKSITEKRLTNTPNHSGYIVDESMVGIKILKSYFQDNNATVEIEFESRGLNINTLGDEGQKIERVVSLTKEGNAWKITKFKRVRKSKWMSLEQLK